MAKIVPCPYCLGDVYLGAETCPHCKKDLQNRNPEGALAFGTQLCGGRYTIGDYQFADGEGLTYRAVENEARMFLTIKEYFPVTLSSGRARDGSIRPRSGSEVLFKTARMDFQDLYETLRKITPANGLVTVLNLFDANNTSYAVMENAKGVTLTRYLKMHQKPLSTDEVLEMLTPVMEGVNYLHKHGMIHRGICPDNILLPIDGTARLTGYATLGLRTAGSELKAKLYSGYSAPEQYSAAEFEGNYTDVYALCAVIYRMLSGRVLPVATQRRELARQQKDAIPPLNQLNSGVPAYFAKVVDCGLRLNTERRLQTVPELMSGLTDKEEAKAMFTHVRENDRVSTGKMLGVFAGIIVGIAVVVLMFVLMGGKEGQEDVSSESASSQTESASSSEPAVAPLTEIPNFVGMNFADIRYNEEYTANFRFTTTVVEDSEEEEGTVLSQTPEANTTIAEQKPTVQLVISKGVQKVTMPAIIGMSRGDAEAALQNAGITYSILTLMNNGEYTPGCVAECSIAPGTEFDASAQRVSVYIAGEVQEIPVPDEGDDEGDGDTPMDDNGGDDSDEDDEDDD